MERIARTKRGHSNATVGRFSQNDRNGPLKRIVQKLGLTDGHTWIRDARKAISWPSERKKWPDLSDQEQARALESFKNFALMTVKYDD